MTDIEFSRAATLEDLKRLIQSLNDNLVPYILIGGYALFAHGYHRSTEDIDVLIPARSELAPTLIKALMVLPDKAAKDLKSEWLDEGGHIRIADEIVIDLIFKACGETYETLQPYVEQIDIDGIAVSTLNIEGLLRTKQTDREKDVIDRKVLERALHQRILNPNP